MRAYRTPGDFDHEGAGLEPCTLDIGRRRADIPHADGCADSVTVRRRCQVPDADTVAHDRLTMEQQRLGIAEGELHEAAGGARFARRDGGVAADEVVL